jgi:hypothetical protein
VTEILDLSFVTIRRFRPLDLLAPGFDVPAEEWSGAEGAAFVTSRTPPEAPYAAVTAALGSSTAPVALGLATQGDDHVVVRWSPAESRITLEVRHSGRARVLRRRKLKHSGPFGLAFVLCENQVTALVDVGAGWRPVLTERARIAKIVDLRQEEELRKYRYAYSDPDGAAVQVRAGLFGHTGLRDPHLVQHADGTPYVRDGRQFLTWTSAGLGFFPQAHWSVWSFEPSAPDEMRLDAKLFSARGGLVLGDHAGHIVRDGDRWQVAVSSWGDFGEGPIHVRHLTTTDDLLSGVHVLHTEPTPVPTRHGTWDPGLLRVDGAWHLSFVESVTQTPFDFRPALARTTADDWTSGLERVPLEGDWHQCEGPVLVRVGGQPWLVASDEVTKSYPVFDLDGKRAGQLSAAYPTNIPHPQLIPDPAGGWFLVTFDGSQFAERVMGYGGHGDVVIMHTV